MCFGYRVSRSMGQSSTPILPGKVGWGRKLWPPFKKAGQLNIPILPGKTLLGVGICGSHLKNRVNPTQKYSLVKFWLGQGFVVTI